MAALLLAFAYLSQVEAAPAPENIVPRLSRHFRRLLFILRLSRLGAVVGAVLSVQALLHSQASPGVGLIAVVALALLAFLVMVDRGTKFVSMRYTHVASRLALPLQGIILRFLSLSAPGKMSPVEPGAANYKEYNGEPLDPHDPSATVVITPEEQASLDDRERLMIRSILRLDESTAREVMVPRVDIVAIEADTPLTEVASRMLDSGHSRLPVYSETIDNVIGVIHSRDLLPFLTETGQYPTVERVIRPAFFIPETKRLDELLTELQEKRVQMAMVVDEYGGIEGLVTLEDLLEEIVGEIEDEFSRSREPSVVPMPNGDIIADARVTLDDLSDLLSTPIGNEDVDTLGGLVYSALGKMPQVGDEVVYNGLSIEVLSVLGRRIRKIKLSQSGIEKAQ